MNEKGKAAEQRAKQYLLRKGYGFIAANYMTRVGEVDLIMKDGKTLVFVEVKERKNDYFGRAVEAVDIYKQRQISRAAAAFVQAKRLSDVLIRFDVVAIDGDQLQHITDAFYSQVRL